jgi:hypothetical protein
MRTEMLAWLLHLHGRRLRQEPPPRRGAEGLQQIGRFEHSLIKRNRKFVDSPLEGAVTSELVSEVKSRSSQKSGFQRVFG